MAVPALPQLQQLPPSLNMEGAISIELVEGFPVLRAAAVVQDRVQELLHKQQDSQLSIDEEQELDQYEFIDDYVSLLNRIVRNALQSNKQ
jgi:hypothetical protein